MSFTRTPGMRLAGVSTCVPARVVDNNACAEVYGETEVRKVVSMAGVQYRPVTDPGVTATDLCFEAAERLLRELAWAPDTLDAIVLVTQSPDYFLPSSSCMIHKWLGLSEHCAALDVGLGCSGYPYGLSLAGSMLLAGCRRILLLQGDTPTQFVSAGDHATTLLFSDAGSATALERQDDAPESFHALCTDGTGYRGLIIPGGGFRDRNPVNPRDRELHMDGGAIFNFTVKRVPEIIGASLQFAGLGQDAIDYFIFHQSNRFIMKHIAKKCGLAAERVPLILDRFGNCGGTSVPLTLTQSVPAQRQGDLRLLCVGYGVGLSWGASVLSLDSQAPLLHQTYSGEVTRQ